MVFGGFQGMKGPSFSSVLPVECSRVSGTHSGSDSLEY